MGLRTLHDPGVRRAGALQARAVAHTALPAAPAGIAELQRLQSSVGNAALARLVAAGAADAAPAGPTLAQRLVARAGSGRALDHGVRRSLERSMGVDLGDVRVHDDAEAASMAADAGALAFTSGRDVYFGAGQHRPGTSEGLRTLAHEAAHVVQQAAGPVAGTDTDEGVRVSDPTDADERAADRTADAVVAGEPVAPARGGAPGARAAAPAVQRACGCGCGGAAGGCGAGKEELDDAPALQRLAAPGAGTPVVQRKQVTAGDLDVEVTPRAVFKAAFQAPGGRVETLRGIPLDDAGHGTVQVADGEEAVGLDLTETLVWKQSGRGGPGPLPKPPIPGIPGVPNLPNIPIPPGLQAACNPCLVLQLPAVQSAIQFAPKAVRDMTKDCARRGTFKERRDFVEAFLRIVAGDPCLLLQESPLKVQINKIPVIGPILPKTTVGVAEACRLGKFVPVVSEIMGGISAGLNIGLTALNALPAEAICNNVTPVDPPTPGGAQGTATVRFTTRFVAEGGRLQPFGPGPISNVSGTGASLEQPVQSGRSQAGTGANVNVAPALLKAGTPDRAQDLIDVDVQPAAPPSPVNLACSDSFSPFKTSKATFEDEPRAIERIHGFFHGLHPKVKQALRAGQGTIAITGRASRSGPEGDNQRFAEQRAERVAAELRRAAGSGATLRTSSTGSLAAATTGNDPGERRADVDITLRLEGSAARDLNGQDPCSGGSISDPVATTDQGAPVPVDAGADAPAGPVDAAAPTPAPVAEAAAVDTAPVAPALELPSIDLPGLDAPAPAPEQASAEQLPAGPAPTGGLEQFGLEEPAAAGAPSTEGAAPTTGEEATISDEELQQGAQTAGPGGSQSDLEELLAGV